MPGAGIVAKEAFEPPAQGQTTQVDHERNDEYQDPVATELALLSGLPCGIVGANAVPLSSSRLDSRAGAPPNTGHAVWDVESEQGAP